ncbi:MAG: hypothetical protein AAFU57_16220 [Bacteroidota bacterium]
MEKKETSYKGIVKPLPHFKIYLNVDHLNEGNYTLHITYKGKTIEKLHFKK